MRNASSLSVGMMLLFALTTAGCGGPSHAVVTGKVTLDGKPISSGIVSFEPVGEGRTASAAIQADGSFRLTCDGATGAKPGEYRIAVRQRIAVGEEDPVPTVVPEDLAPAAYGSTATSGLTFVVQSGAENDVPIKLSSKYGQRN